MSQQQRKSLKKSLGSWYKDGFTDRHKGIEIYHRVQGLKLIDKARLSGKFKVWYLASTNVQASSNKSSVY